MDAADAERERSPLSAETQPDCQLSDRQQTVNLIIFGLNKCLIYLAAPVTYVGIVQAALCEQFRTTNAVANLPATMYFLMTPLPIVLAWYFCSVRSVKPVLMAAYLVQALSGAAVAGVLLLPTAEWVIPAVIIHAAILGAAGYTAETFQWEVLSRGLGQKRRGLAFSFAYGVGPLLAFAGSLGSQLVLDKHRGLAFPGNFALLYGLTLPIMVVPALLTTRYIVPAEIKETPRLPFVSGVFGGFRIFFAYRVLAITAVAYVLIMAGFNILPNMSLFTEHATGESAAQFAGLQNTCRFGFKSLAGFFLGWLMVRASPRACLLATAAFCLTGVLWIWQSPGAWFLVAFGLMGAGELSGWYYPNYMVQSSTKADVRRNAAVASILVMPAAPAGWVFGAIADRFASPLSVLAASIVALIGAAPVEGILVSSAILRLEENTRAHGLIVSFQVAVAVFLLTLAIVLLLPARPQPRSTDHNT